VFEGRHGGTDLSIKVGGKLPTDLSKKCVDIIVRFKTSNNREGKYKIYVRNDMTIEAFYFKTKNNSYRLDQVIDDNKNVFEAEKLEYIKGKNRVLIPNSNVWVIRYGGREQNN
jgi:hypothetical protein